MRAKARASSRARRRLRATRRPSASEPSPVEGEIGEHAAHERLVDEAALEGGAVRRPVMRLAQRGAHQPRGRHRGVEPGVVHHLDDGAHAPPFLADLVRQGAVVFDLGRGVGAVAELVLEAHGGGCRCASPSSQRGTRKQVEPARCLRQRQEPVGHRRRAEPLVPRQAPASPSRLGARGVGAHVRAALLFGHRHAQRRAALFRAAARRRGRSRARRASGAQSVRGRSRGAPARRRRSWSAGSNARARPGSRGRPSRHG